MCWQALAFPPPPPSPPPVTGTLCHFCALLLMMGHETRVRRWWQLIAQLQLLPSAVTVCRQLAIELSRRVAREGSSGGTCSLLFAHAAAAALPWSTTPP